MKFLAFLAALVVLLPIVSGLTLYSTTDKVDMASNVNGQLTLWFQASEPTEYAVNTVGPLLTAVSPSSGNVDAGAVKSFVVTFNAPLCSQGTFYETINLDYSANGVNQRVSKVVEVNVQRSVDCGAVVVRSYPQSLRVNDNANSISRSSISLANSFDSSEVNVAIQSRDGISDVANGENAALVVNVVNRGSPGLFTVSLVADPSLGASLTDYSFVLERSEVKPLTLTVSPRGAQGRQWAAVQVTRSGQVVAVKDIYVDVANAHLLELSLPQVAKVENCGLATIAGTAYNKGSAVETVTASIPALGVSSNAVVLQPRSSTQFVINVDVSRLSPGARLVEVVLLSQAATVNAKQVMQLEVKQCSESQAGQLLNYSVEVTNTGSEPLVGVTAIVTDVPQEWQVLTQYPIDVAAGETKTLTALVRPKGNWEQDVVPTLVVKDAAGNEIKRQSVSPIRANSVTGLFLAGTFGLSGLQWIVVMVFVALVIAVASAKMSLKRSR